MQLKKVTKEQVTEWFENPVTLAFKAGCESEKEDIESAIGIDVFHPYEPQKTQEVLAGLNAAADTWEVVIDALTEIDEDDAEAEPHQFERY